MQLKLNENNEGVLLSDTGLPVSITNIVSELHRLRALEGFVGKAINEGVCPATLQFHFERLSSWANDLPSESLDLKDVGPWRVGQNEDEREVFLQSDDFTHDARLYINGDFEDVADQLAYAREMAARLNGSLRPVVVPPDQVKKVANISGCTSPPATQDFKGKM